MSRVTKKQKTLEELLEEALVTEAEQPFTLPENWVWVKFGTVAKLVNGYAFKSKDYAADGIPVIRISDLNGINTNTEISVKVPAEFYHERFAVQKGDLLIAMSGATTGKIGIYGSDEAALQNQRVGNIKVIDDRVLDAKYRDYFVMHSADKIKKLAYGGAQPNISGNLIERLLFPLPPLTEQKRVAEKIERLFAKIDETKRLIEEVKESAALRRSVILDKAFRGMLYTNDPNEKSILALSDEITHNELIPSEEILYDLPENWIWVKLGSVAKVKGGKRLPKGHTLLEEQTNFPYLRVTDFKNGSIDLNSVKYIDQETAEKISRYIISQDDVYISIAGTIGKTGIVPSALDGAFLTENAAKITQLTNTFNIFLHFYLNSPILQGKMKKAVVSSSQPKLALFRIEDFHVALPPMDEQKRIVSKLERLLNELEEEKERILEVEDTMDLLKQSILNKAFRGELGTNDPAEESAVESLKEVLQSTRD
ncbi:hypothetical protein BTO30_09690 [Domibacillus antri]|uniref:Type I restriction modification DNA specificity domain-containing protein n=1 Tax=Domibacillus antri TaxID=1714264 RepID=A0A1Q8Q562_9BACI|nr:restriction endonuclease subunit S [Domibacillus antri]OLN22411.1 hypothetical protein BTO30_09690 [Domibacillus antri]